MRAQRMVVSGLAVVAIVAIGTLAAVNVLPNDGNSPRPVPPATGAHGPCLTLNRPAVPSWAKSANPPSGVPHALTADGNVLYFVFSDPMIAGHPTDRQNKILWIVRQPRDGQPLKITGTLPGTNVAPVHYSFPADSAPGEIYPSVVDVPAPGCWHFDLAWNGHRSSVDLGYGAIDQPVATTTTTTVTTTTIPAASASTCHTAELTVTIGQPSGAAGSVGYELGFRNDSPLPCTMNGYPGVSFLDGSGNQIGVPADRNQIAHTPVTVAPGATAYALLVVGNPDVYNCPVAVPQKLKVYPPNETAFALVDAVGIRTCSNQVVDSHVNPVRQDPNI
jgi:hypothetical protein